MKKNVYDEIQKIKNLHDQEISDAVEKLHDAEAEKEKCEAKADAALESGKVEEYTAARALVREAEDKVDYYNNKIENLKTAPYFSDKERNEKNDEINKDIMSVKETYLKSICKSAKDCCDLINELISREAKANDAIDILEANTKVIIGKYYAFDLIAIRNRLDLSNIETLKEYWK